MNRLLKATIREQLEEKAKLKAHYLAVLKRIQGLSTEACNIPQIDLNELKAEG